MGILNRRNQYKTAPNTYPRDLMYIYYGIKERYRRHPKYKDIEICKEWVGEYGASNFYEWALANGYKKGLSIDRIDNLKGYSTENCRWIPKTLQQKNREIVKSKGELHHIEVLPSGNFRVSTGSRKNRIRNVFTSRAEAIKYRDKKLREEEEYAWYPYKG